MNAIKLETNAYSLFYGKFHALEDISLKILGKEKSSDVKGDENESQIASCKKGK